MSLKQQFKNALSIIKQIKNEEWKFTGHYEFDFTSKFKCYTAKRNGIELWVANGFMSCGIKDQPWQVGFFGILIWHFGAKQRVKALEKKMKRRPTDLSL